MTGRTLRVVRTVVALALTAVLAWGLSGCAARSGGQAGVSSSSSALTAGENASPAGFRNPDLGNGWPVERSAELAYASCFTLDYYEGGYALACLLDGGRYLIVPEGAQVPSGLAGDITVIRQPIEDVYLVASDTMCLFDALGALDSISVSGIAEADWRINAAVEAMRSGAIAYGGKYSAPDYDTLLARGVSLSIQSTMINHAPEVREKLIELGIDVLTEQSSNEPDPLGRSEWVKLYGAMLGKEELAQRLFDEQVAQAQLAMGKETDKTVAFFYINSNGAAVVRKPGDYVSRMIDLAGGRYVFDSLAADDSARSTVTMEMERFYAEAKDADVIVYNATIDNAVDSIEDVVARNELLANFKAVQDGQVWLCEQNMYQQMMNSGDIIADFSAALSGSQEELTYLRKLS